MGREQGRISLLPNQRRQAHLFRPPPPFLFSPPFLCSFHHFKAFFFFPFLSLFQEAADAGWPPPNRAAAETACDTSAGW